MWKRAILLLISFFLALPATAGEIRFSAAASLKDVLASLEQAWSHARPGVKFIVNTGASGALARQIEQGAPADIFISAHPQWIEFLVGRGAILSETVEVLAANRLVFVGLPGRDISSLHDLPQVRRISMGSPRSVPAGQYAEEALQNAGVYDQLRGKLVMTQDVRQALVHADRGEVDGAFVYRTDAPLARNAVVYFEISQELHSPIIYPMGMTPRGKENPEAASFYRFLQGEDAREILKAHGFEVRQ